MFIENSKWKCSLKLKFLKGSMKLFKTKISGGVGCAGGGGGGGWRGGVVKP